MLTNNYTKIKKIYLIINCCNNIIINIVYIIDQVCTQNFTKGGVYHRNLISPKRYLNLDSERTKYFIQVVLYRNTISN